MASFLTSPYNNGMGTGLGDAININDPRCKENAKRKKTKTKTDVTVDILYNKKKMMFFHICDVCPVHVFSFPLMSILLIEGFCKCGVINDRTR